MRGKKKGVQLFEFKVQGYMCIICNNYLKPSKMTGTLYRVILIYHVHHKRPMKQPQHRINRRF